MADIQVGRLSKSSKYELSFVQTFPLTFSSCRGRAGKFKEYTKKHAADAKFVVSLFKLTAFLTFCDRHRFRCLRPGSDAALFMCRT